MSRECLLFTRIRFGEKVKNDRGVAESDRPGLEMAVQREDPSFSGGGANLTRIHISL